MDVNAGGRSERMRLGHGHLWSAQNAVALQVVRSRRLPLVNLSLKKRRPNDGWGIRLCKRGDKLGHTICVGVRINKRQQVASGTGINDVALGVIFRRRSVSCVLGVAEMKG